MKHGAEFALEAISNTRISEWGFSERPVVHCFQAALQIPVPLCLSQLDRVKLGLRREKDWILAKK